MTNVKCTLAALAAGSLLAVATPVGAAPIAYEGFDYAAGATVLNGGSGWSGGWAPRYTGNSLGNIQDTSLIAYPGLPTSGNMLQLPASPNWDTRTLNTVQGTSGDTLWISFLTKRNSARDTSNPTVRLLDGSGNISIELRAPSISTEGSYPAWRVAVGGEVADATSPSIAGTNTSNATFFVIKVQFKDGADDVTVWGNPNLALGEAGLGTGTAINGVADISIASFRYWARGQSNQTQPYLDEIRFSTTFQTVVPEPVAMGVLPVVAGAMLLRRRRT